VDANGNTLGYSFQPTANFNNSTWTYYEIVFTVPEGAIGTHIALTAVNLGLDTSTGTICFDDVSVKEIP
jgi:hypothetical protein